MKPELQPLLRRLGHARRVMVLHGPGLHPWPYALNRGGEVLGEMARHFQELLVLDEEQGLATWQGRRGLQQGDAASLPGAFMCGGLDLCLIVGATCQTAEAAGAVAAAWRSGAWIQGLGDPRCELEALVKGRVDGPASLLLDEVWDAFTSGADPN